MKSSITLITIFLAVLSLQAQYHLLYQHTYVQGTFNAAQAVAGDNQGNRYLAGNFSTSITIGNISLTSANATGYYGKFNTSSNAWAWVKKITPSGKAQCGLDPYSNIVGMTADNTGNVYIVGSYLGTITLDNISLTSTKNGSCFTYDLFVAKINTNGTCIWAKTFGTKNGADFGYAIALDGSGNVFISGQFSSNITCSGITITRYDAFLAKLNNSGAIQWQKQYTSTTPCAGGEFSVHSDVDADASGNVYLSGSFSGSASFGSGSGLTVTSSGLNDIYVAKINTSGTTQWVRAAGLATSNDIGHCVTEDGGNVYTGGRVNGISYLAKYSSSGMLQWTAAPFTENLPGNPLYQTLIRNIISYNGAILAREQVTGLKLISPLDGSTINSDLLTGNNSTGTCHLMALAPAGSEYVLAARLNTGTVNLGNLPLTSSCSNNCSLTSGDIALISYDDSVPPCADADSDGVCNDDDVCPGFNDNLIGAACNDGNECTINDVYLGAPACGCAGTPVPGCVPCNPQTASLTPNPLHHTGTGTSSTNMLSLPGGSFDASFTITGLDAKLNGQPNGRYIDRVMVWYNAGSGEQLYGAFNGDQQSTVNVSITGSVLTIRVTLEDGYDGNSGVTQSVSFGAVTYCSGGALPIQGSGGNTLSIEWPYAPGLDGDFDVYPNPAQQVIHIRRHQADAAATFTLHNHLGQVIRTEYMAEGRLTASIDLEHLAAGIYFISSVSGDKVLTQRVMVTR